MDASQAGVILTMRRTDTTTRLLTCFTVLCGTVCLSLFAPLSSKAVDQVFSIAYYPIEKNAYNGETPLNGVIRIPVEKMESRDCCSVLTTPVGAGNESKMNVCKPITRELFTKCSKEARGVFRGRSDADTFLNMATLETGKKGKAFLYVEYCEGGSGGGRCDWSLYLIRNDGEELLPCYEFLPPRPFLSGTEVTPGGKVWYETVCNKKESYDKCAERISYPKKNAFQVLFTTQGIVTRPLPANAPNPTYR
jgi:hypothetical protein